MKNNILAAALLLLPLWAQAGEITAGSTPQSINYQGRLERDNAPITGTIHLYFRVYNHATNNGAGTSHCGETAQPCLWQSDEITVEATQGVFSANLDFTEAQMMYVFSGASQKYLEVQVESDVLSPREPINSVVYAMLAKKLEDGSSVSVTTLTANYQVLLATAASAKVGIGTNSPTQKLTIDGGIELRTLGNGITFPNGTVMTTAGVGSAVNGVTSDDFVTIRAANVTPNTDIIFNTPLIEIARMTYAGNMGIGTPAPAGKLEVDGSLIIGTEGISDRDDGTVNINEDLSVAGGNISGTGSNYLSIGETANTLIAGTNGADRAWLDASGNLGVGAAAPASERIYASGNVRATSGVRGSNVSIGAYNNAWTGLANEVRAADSTDLLLQHTNTYAVGIGTNTPREKLHVHGTVLSDYGVRASTALFTSNVSVNGDFTANGNNKNVYLTSTTIYGTLTVTGGMASQAGMPAYIASTQTFTGLNTFRNQLLVSSDIVTPSRMGVAVTDFDFAGERYLQVGDDKVEYSADDTSAYLVGGSGANAKLRFYRGPTESASIETSGGRNLAVVVQGQAKTLTDVNYHRIQNAALWVSTGYASTPAIFVSSTMGNVGMGTSVMDPNWKLTVEGNLRISTISSPGQSYGIIFADGSMMTTANQGSALSLSNNSDAVVQADADQSGSGSVLLRSGSLDGLILTSGGNVGIGTVNPVAKLNVRGGDLVLGTPVNPYASNGVEDLVIGGNTVFDGALIQRSASAVELANLVVANSVYLSTGTGSKAAIGTNVLSPTSRLYVANGDINLDSTFGIRVNNTAPVRQYLRGNGANFAASLIQPQDIPANIVRDTFTVNTTLPLAGGGNLQADLTLSIGGLSANGAANQLVGISAAPAVWEYKTLNNVANETTVDLSVPGQITIGIADPLIVGKGGTGLAALAQGSILYGNGGNPLSALAKDTNASRYLSNTGASNDPAWAQVNLTNGVSGILPVVNGGTGANSLTGVLRGNGVSPVTVMTGTSGRIVRWDASNNAIENSNIIDDGTTINVTTRKIINIVDPTNNQDAATKKYVDDQSGSSGGLAWSKTGNNVDALIHYMGSIGNDDVVFKRFSAERMRLLSGGVSVTGNISVTGTVDGYDVSASGANWDAAYTHSGDVTGAVHGATSANSINMIVRRDGSGNFSAGTITATLSGSASALANTLATGNSAITAINSGNTSIDWARVNKTGSSIANLATRSASDINSGTLAVSYGGTGRTTLNSGEVLVGNGTTGVNTVAGAAGTQAFTVARTTSTTGSPCNTWTFTNGVLVSVGPNIACP